MPWLDRLPWLLLLLALALCAVLRVQTLRAQQQLDALRLQVAQQRLRTEQQARAQVVQAAAAADAAVLAAQQRTTAALSIASQLRHEIDRLASDRRPCLSAATVRVLERHPAFRPGVPARPGQPVAAAAAASLHAREPERATSAALSSERDVATWALEAAGLYEQCRARLQAIAQWDADAHHPAPR